MSNTSTIFVAWRKYNPDSEKYIGAFDTLCSAKCAVELVCETDVGVSAPPWWEDGLRRYRYFDNAFGFAMGAVCVEDIKTKETVDEWRAARRKEEEDRLRQKKLALQKDIDDIERKIVRYENPPIVGHDLFRDSEDYVETLNLLSS